MVENNHISMSFYDDRSVQLAKNLKQLREDRGLSHKKLSDAIFANYCVKISDDSLKNYEVTEKNHSRFGKIKGMNIEYLVCLADFFGVSTDYLLGLTGTRSKDENVQAVTSLTRLTENAANALVNEDTPSILGFLDAFLELPKRTKEKLGDCFFAYTHIKSIQPLIEKKKSETSDTIIHEAVINGRQLPKVPIEDALDYSRFELTRTFMQLADEAYERGL